MIRPIRPTAIILLSVATITLLAGCGSDEDQKPSNPRQIRSESQTEATPAPDTGAPTPAPEKTNPASSSPTPPPPPPSSPPPGAGPAATPATIPYAQPVPGKPGFVVSPYSKDGYVDVRGFPPGTEVKDPYTQKVFLVP